MENLKNQYPRLEELINSYLEGHLSTEEEKELVSLLNSGKEMQAYFEGRVRNYAKMFIPRFEENKNRSYKIVLAYIQSRRKDRWKKNVMQLLKVAAVVLFLLSVSFSYYLLNRDMERTKTAGMQSYRMEAPLGSQTKLQLPDGSSVHLNSGSVLEYKSSFMMEKKREIYLFGEAYIEVRKDAGRPFIVHTDELNIQVLGTKFNVKSYREDRTVELNLLEGSIKVSFPSGNNGNYLLSPDENLVYDKPSKHISIHKVNARNAAAWTLGKLSFVKTPLIHILKDIERIYNVRFDIHSSQVEKEIFTGRISTKFSIEEILNYIDVDHKYVWTYEGNRITLRDK